MKSGPDSSIMVRKYFCNIGAEFANAIAEDFGIRLSDFVHYEK